MAGLWAVCSAAEFSGDLRHIEGDVQIDKGNGWITALEGLPVERNDRIRTGGGASCSVDLDDGSVIEIGDGTEAVFDELSITPETHTSQINLLFGRIIASVASLRTTRMRVNMPTAVCAVRGTEFAVEATSMAARCGVFTGAVAVSGTGTGINEVLVNPDEETVVDRGVMPRRPERLKEQMLRNRERMTAIRARVAALHERLKRVPGKQRRIERENVRARFLQMRDRRRTLNEELRQRNDGIKKRARRENR
jgi:hypothetical protein